MKIQAEIRAVKSAKETKCLQVVLVTNELSNEDAGKLFALKDSPVELTIEEIKTENAF